jgi:hypothetical protein
MKRLAAVNYLGEKFVFKIEVWYDQKELLDELKKELEKDKEIITFDHFLESTNKQLHTFILYSNNEEGLQKYRDMPVRKNKYLVE